MDRETLARVVHAVLSKHDVMAYLDMPSDAADVIATAILPLFAAKDEIIAGCEQAVTTAYAVADEYAAKLDAKDAEIERLRDVERIVAEWEAGDGMTNQNALCAIKAALDRGEG